MKNWRLLFASLLYLIVVTMGCGNEQPTEQVLLTGDMGIDQLSQQISEKPQEAELYALRAELHYDKDNFDQAIADMQAALTLDSINLDYHHLLADIYLDYYRSRLAMQTMERAVAVAPEDVFSWLKLSEIQLFLKQNQSSLSSLDKALRLDQNNALAFFLMGRNFEELGDINRAINSYQEASENDPEMLDAWIKLGQLHAAIDGSLAESFFDNAIEIDSSSTLALSAKAEYLWDQENPQGALALYREAILKTPMDERNYFNAGLVYLELDSLDKAYEHFDIAVQNEPLYVNAYYYRGFAAESLGQLDQAKRDYEQAIRLAPERNEAHEALARISSQ